MQGRKKTKAQIVVWGFVFILLMPSLDQLFGLSTSFENTEKRMLTPFPTFVYPRLQTFAAQFTQYYNDNFGWRNALFYQYSRWKYNWLHTSPIPEKVILGKHGWFYPGNSMNRILDRHQGRFIPQDTMAAVARRLTKYQRQLAIQGTKLYLLVAPDSYTIYPENLPDYLQHTDSQANFNYIKRYLLQHTTIPFVDVRKALLTAKRDRMVYFQTDTHWNSCGSLVATLALVSRLRQDFPNVPAPHVVDYKARTRKGYGGDLVALFAMNGDITDSVEYLISLPKNQVIRRTESIQNTEMNFPSERFISTSTKGPKLLFIGDSYSYWMKQFLPGYLRESYQIHTHRLDVGLVKEEHPDIVVVEIVERDVDLIGSAK